VPKILFITTNFENGAIPNILNDLAPHWLKLGWQLHALALEPLPSGHASVTRWRTLGLGLESLNLAAKDTFAALGPLRRAIRRIAPDLIHTHLGRADVYTPWVKGRIPLVTTFHSVRRNAGRSTQLGWKLSDGMVAHRTGVSQACIDSFYADGFLKSDHSVVYNPVSPERLVPGRNRAEVLAHFGWDGPVRLLLAVGRLVPVKGHAELLTGFATMAATRPDLRLVIAGDGPLHAELSTQAARLGISDKVRLAGAWPRVGDLYGAADLLVFPSHWEGLGLVPLEALACGCPVASSRLPAVAEFLVEGENGRFFEAGHPDDLARVAGAMVDDPAGSRVLAARGGEMVRLRFAPAAIAGQYDAIYREALRG
jgi:glycosyltransferase involved in cell wall biosynthesis